MKQRYDSYKPSGIDWIGDIPSHWTVMPVKYVLDNLDYLRQPISAEDRERNNPQYDYYGASGVIDQIDYYNVEDTVLLIGEDGANLVMRNLPLIYKASGKFWVNNHAHILKPQNGYDYSYLAHLLEAGDYTLFITGSAQPKLSQENLNKYPICIPPLAEQEAIAAWLDEKCGEIDAAIAKVDREIELIDELKQSEISRVVTRGLNPDTPLRPSDIDWIGNIPEHWAIRKVAQIFHGIGSGTTPTSGSNKYYSEDGVNWLQTGDLNDGNINDTSKKITTTALTDFSSLKIYPKGSIVIAMYGATIGKLGKLNIETTTNQACCVLPKSNEIDNDFAFYVFWAGKRALINSAYGGGQPNISQDTIKSFKFALPPLSEQQAIADYLDKKCAVIDGLKAKLTKKRETLTELRQSIISEVVTGKRKII